MVPARILIISNGPLCRNPRVLKEATALGTAGYAVTVLTVRNHAASEVADRVLMQQATFRRITVDLLPGVGTSRLVCFWRRLQLWLARKLARFGPLRSIHSLGPTRALLAAARRLPSDLVIAHNEIAHWVGLKLLQEGRRIAADIEDWHAEDLLPEHRATRPLDVLREQEHTLLHRAVYTSTTSAALADALHACYAGRRPLVITNSFPLQPAPDPAGTNEPPVFFWFSQTVGPGRGLEPFLAAWNLTTRPSRLVLLGAVGEPYAQELREQITPALRPRFSIIAAVPPRELPEVIARHDLGLALEYTSPPNKDLTISNKILQYLNAGLAVVATATKGQLEVLAGAPDAGVIVETGDPLAMARQLDHLLADHEGLVRRRRAARRLAETTYCWEREVPHLLAAVDRALST